MNEIELPIEVEIAIIIGLLIALCWLIRHQSYFQLHTERLEEQEGNHTRQLTNERYGAYIQSQGKYYN